MSLSRTLEKNGSKLIVLYDVVKSGGLFGFGNRMILENFHRSGKYDSLSMALNIWVSSMIAHLSRHLATSAVI